MNCRRIRLLRRCPSPDRYVDNRPGTPASSSFCLGPCYSSQPPQAGLTSTSAIGCRQTMPRWMAKSPLLQAESQLQSAQVLVPWVNGTTQSGASSASAQLANALAELQRARLTYEQASRSDISYAEANVRARQASNERAQADLAR